MPPRKRARRSGAGPDSESPAATPTPPRTQRARGPPPPRAGSRYRTRHRRDVRGPELVELEGGAADLVPPSDDEEYDDWRALRAVERSESVARQQVAAAKPTSVCGDEMPEAGPSTPRPAQLASSYPRPRGRRSFVPLFSSPTPAGPSRSPSPTSPPSLPSLSSPRPPLPAEAGTPPPASAPLSPSPKASAAATPISALRTSRQHDSPSSPWKGKARADPPPADMDDPLPTATATTSTAPLSPQFSSQATSQATATAASPVARTTIAISSPKPFAMPFSQKGRDYLPSTSPQISPSPPSFGPEALVPPHPPPLRAGEPETQLDMRHDGEGGATVDLSGPMGVEGSGQVEVVGVVEPTTAPIEGANTPPEPPVPPAAPQPRQVTPSSPLTSGSRLGFPMDLDADTGDQSAKTPSPTKIRAAAAGSAQDDLPSRPISSPIPVGRTRSASPMDIEEESQLPIREASPEEPWGMDLDVGEPLESHGDVVDGAAAAPDIMAPTDDAATADVREASLPLVSDAVEQERQPAPAPLPSTLPSLSTASSPPQPSSQRTVVPTPRPSTTTGRSPPIASSQRMPPPSSPVPPRVPTQRPPSQRPPPSPSPDALDLLAANGGTLNVPVVRPPTPQRQDNRTADDAAMAAALSADPALLQFRFMRTFRTRTALQLQPYTKEKQLYENALRKGGLSKGRRAVAPSAEVRAANDQDETQEGDSTSSDSDATPPDAIVIGATQEEAPRRQREPKPLIDADYDEYFLQFGEVADEEEPLCQRRLQVIARQRLRQAREARRKERAAERTRRGFEALMKETDRDKTAEKNKEAEKRAAQTKSATEKRKTDSQKASANGPQRKDQRKDAQSNGASKAPSKPRPAEKSKAKKSSDKVRRDRVSTTPANRTTTGGRPRIVTYSKRQQRPVLSDEDSSPLSSPPSSPSTSQRHVTLPPSDAPQLNTPPQPFPPEHNRAITLSPGMPNNVSADFGDTFDDYGRADSFGGHGPSDDDQPIAIATPDAPRSPLTARPSRSTRRRRIAASSSQSSGSDSSDAAPPDVGNAAHDKRRRIAERMLPRAMLKRLEQQALEQRRKNEERRRRAARTDDSPVRPGHALVRRRGGGGFEALDDLFDQSDNSDSADANDMLAVQAEEGEESDVSPDEHLGRQMVLTLQSDSDGSEAMEDNGRPAALARLQRGDFEAIVHGRRHAEPRPRGEFRRQRERRPALGIAKRVSKPSRHRHPHERRVPNESQLYQTRLDFPVEEKTPDNHRHTKSKGKQKSSHRGDRGRGDARGGRERGQEGARRPAIRLDDNVIFATGDFAFSSDSDDDIEVTGQTTAPRAPPPRPVGQMVAKGGRLYARSTSSPTPAAVPAKSPAPQRHLDEGVGKARSWANFDRFPIDFDITPLPIGVYCSVDSIPGSGQLGAFLGMLDGDAVDEPKPLSAYGVSLHSAIGVDELIGVVPIVVDGIAAAIRNAIDSTSPSSNDKPDLRPLRFFRDHLARSDSETRSAVFPLLNGLSEQLGDIILSGSRANRPLVLQLLEVRYALLEIAAIAGTRENITKEATHLISLLLVYGFDRTVRPLRRILRGEADTPEVIDISVAMWVSVLHILISYDQQHPPATNSAEDTFAVALAEALDQRYRGEVGPLAAERIWFLVFGLCAIAQFGVDGAVVAEYTPYPRWALVKRALGHIKITHSQEVEEAAHLDQLQGRDRYIKTVVARCLRLSSAWQWYFDPKSFSVATRDLGMIFKDRQHRNLPTEPPADFPRFIADFDISLTAADDTRRASAFELWLRLACVAASDLIGAAEELSAAHRAERDVQRLIMSIFPLSAVPFTRTNQPTPRQLGALVNRYSTMVVACYFSPSLLPWLLANSQKWLAFDRADFESRQVCIRGLMYLGVACRHHSHPLDAVVGRLADILATLQAELEQVGKPTNPPGFPTKIEIERTMVLVVSCFRQIILHPGYTPRPEPVYPDPSLLHECRIFQLDLVKDVKSGLEIIATIQAFLDARAAALPGRARAARSSRQQESLDDYPSLGFDFDDVDLAALGGDEAPEDPVERQDASFADTIVAVICPRIYRLLSDMLPAVTESEEPAARERDGAERLVLINKLTQCWSDCAAIAVVEHHRLDWSAYIGPFGQQSWSRIGNELGRIRVGVQFMLNVAHLDPGAFKTHEEEFLALLFQSIVTDRLTVEHKYAAAVFALPGALDHPLFEGVRDLGVTEDDLTRTGFTEKRVSILETIFSNIPMLLRSRFTPAAMKPLIYRCMNVLVASIALYEGAIDVRRVLHRQGYRVFGGEVVRALRRAAGEVVSEMTVPALRMVAWA